jgi:HEAT repeat protein
LSEAAHQRRPTLFGPAIDLTIAVANRSKEPGVLCAARAMARAALNSGDASTRVRAVELATLPGVDMRKDTAPLLSDPDAEVRRAAMIAVGEWPTIIHTDSLLSWLHDPDPVVRRLCEQALRGKARGNLSGDFIRLGKLVTDPRWDIRLSVLDYLDDVEDLDPAIWLRRLSHDASPAVRAAAIRAACDMESVDLSDRLDQMARDDPSQTVSGLARHYLQQQKHE